MWLNLIDGATDRHVWADRYDRDLTDIFALQDEITETIVKQLKVKLLPEEKKAIGQVQTENADAYTAYLNGAKLLRNLTKSSLLRAQKLFTKAVELDPKYARAYAGLANCATWLKTHHGSEITVDEILAFTDNALKIDPKLADAFAARGAAMWIDDNRTEAFSAFKQALTLAPNNYEAHFYFGRFLETIGDFEQATGHYMRATEIQPDDYQAPSKLAGAFIPIGRIGKVYEYAQIGLKRAEEALRRNPENSRPAQLGSAILAYLGETERAKEWLKLALEIDPDDNHVRYNAACTYARLGEIDHAFDLLEIWIENAANNLRLWFKNDPDLEPIRTHQRYRKLLERADA